MPDPGMSPQDCWQDKKPEVRVRKVLFGSTVSGKVTKQGGPYQDEGHNDGVHVLSLKVGSPSPLKFFF